MDLRQLEAFAAVMSAGSVTAAGKMLGRSQPSVTRVIQELEQELGFALFERSGPKVMPTQKAFMMYGEVESALLGIRNIRQRAQHIAREESNQIKLVAISALAAGLLPVALSRLPDSLRPQQIQLQSMSPENVVQAVLSKTMDLGAVSLPLEHRGLDIHWIGEAPCVAVLPASSELAVHEVLSMELLAQQTLITMANPYRFRRRVDKAFQDAGGAPPRMLDTNTSLIAMQMARVGLGVALVDPFTARGVPLEGVVVRPIACNIPFFFGLISAFASPLSDVARALIGEIAASAKLLLPQMIMHEAGVHDALLQSIYAE
ncbi:LysR family transcriptional regulator [Pseudomonas sp. GM33]|jgi:DNA-binding transcriptional LysR family regulator|uniref:LysR family transcriptional regulator n=1 Tax=Pseudomonas TaxID=286 RepID=UPI0002703471|nr:LysR family transcriptional regulator [Pseudomonas sp. GM33]EJM35078.1 transcriptional regulator [Pseudomonas sp. GM33]MDF9897965.1 DNA-binding transcriptional LysR family regulator [Pseudomonas reinekei]MDP9653712.1 DNA-binding transcriptional LysR family regulator [Pseudomonas putida]